MSDLFYSFVRRVGTMAFWVSSRPVVLHLERTRQKGAFILAATHQSPYDVPLLIRHSHRRLDFVSIVEVFRNPWVAWFYGSMNSFPIDRSKPDSQGVRTILDRLGQGRVIAMFPEGNLRRGKDSVVHGGKMRPGVGRLAVMSGVPIVPCVIVQSTAYERLSAWLPLRRIQYGINFGEPIAVTPDADRIVAAQMLEDKLRNAMISLHRELVAKMGGKTVSPSGYSSPEAPAEEPDSSNRP